MWSWRALCAARDADAVRQCLTANNQRLFRAAWSILKDRAEAEEAVQAAYVTAFSLDRRVRRPLVAVDLADADRRQ